MRDYGLEMFWQHKCEQEVVLLCQKYDAGMVRRALAKLTPSGAPRKPDEYYLQVWLAVELFRFYTPAANVACACNGVARFFLRRSTCAKRTTAAKTWVSRRFHLTHTVCEGFTVRWSDGYQKITGCAIFWEGILATRASSYPGRGRKIQSLKMPLRWQFATSGFDQ